MIVWAHNGHIVRSAQLFFLDHQPSDFENAKSMGEYIAERYGEQAYSVALLAYQGETSYAFSSAPPVAFKVRGGSLEKLMHKTGNAFLFLNLRSDALPKWLIQERIAAPFDYNRQRAVWRDIWDAFFFSDVMEGSTR